MKRTNGKLDTLLISVPPGVLPPPSPAAPGPTAFSSPASPTTGVSGLRLFSSADAAELELLEGSVDVRSREEEVGFRRRWSGIVGRRTLLEGAGCFPIVDAPVFLVELEEEDDEELVVAGGRVGASGGAEGGGGIADEDDAAVVSVPRTGDFEVSFCFFDAGGEVVDSVGRGGRVGKGNASGTVEVCVAGGGGGRGGRRDGSMRSFGSASSL
jgi:hypothetical protein